ncbi:elongation factor Ts [Chloroflexota bacterium]
MKISINILKDLREQSGAGIMACRNALDQTAGDIEKAIQILREQSILRVEEKAERTASEGLIEAYIHTGGRIGAMVEINCETDFVARTDAFKELAHNLAMQVAATDPTFIAEEDVTEETEVEPQLACLLCQPYIRDPGLTIRDIINDIIAKVGENIKVARFARFELGEMSEDEAV